MVFIKMWNAILAACSLSCMTEGSVPFFWRFENSFWKTVPPKAGLCFESMVSFSFSLHVSGDISLDKPFFTFNKQKMRPVIKCFAKECVRTTVDDAGSRLMGQ